jgi:hypothetical protein
VAALLGAAREAAQRLAVEAGEQAKPPATVADAVLALVRDGDGSLAGLDVPELEPMAGVVTVVEVEAPLAPQPGATDTVAPFQLGADDLAAGRYDEPPYLDSE